MNPIYSFLNLRPCKVPSARRARGLLHVHCFLARERAGRLLHVQMVSFGVILNHFGLKATQTLHMTSFGNILVSCGPNAAQMLQM